MGMLEVFHLKSEVQSKDVTEEYSIETNLIQTGGYKTVIKRFRYSNESWIIINSFTTPTPELAIRVHTLVYDLIRSMIR